jgi:hypothetical protein
MPETSVAEVGGAMIILIRRRNTSGSSFSVSAVLASVVLSAGSARLSA